MNPSRLVLAAVIVGSLAGCLAPVERQDPLAGLSVQAPDAARLFPRLSLGLVESANTRNAQTPLKQAAGLWSATAIFGGRAFDHRKIIGDYADDLRKNFRSVVPLQKVEDGASAGVDLIGVLDVYPTMPAANGKGLIRMEAGIVFLDTGGRQIASVKGAAEEFSPDNSHPATVLLNVNQASRRALQRDIDSNRDTIARAGADASPAGGRTAVAPAQPKAVESDVDRPSYKTGEDPRRFALVIGVERYSALPPADYAERDAQAVREHLLALGFPARNIVYLAGSGATKTGIEKFVETWLPRNTDENSRVLVYFSGHGAPEPKTGQAYLVPWDGDPKYLQATGYPISRLYEKLESLKAREVIVALDSCFSGAGGRSVLAKGTRPLVVLAEAGIGSLSKIVVLSAAGQDEITGTDESKGHGLFTYWLLKGLNEKGGRGSARDIFDYLVPKVQDAARMDNREQTPRLQGRAEATARFD